MSTTKTNNAKARGLIAAALIFAVALASWGAVQALGASSSQERHFALVHDAEGNTNAFDLSVDTEQAITTTLGTNTISVKEGKASIVSADCDNQDCIRQGSIDSPSQQIICLPHKLWVEVVTANSEEEALQSGSSQDENKTGSFDATSR